MQVKHISQEELQPILCSGAGPEALRSAIQKWKSDQAEVARYRITTAPTPDGLKGAQLQFDLLKELGFECRRERIEFERPSGSPPLDRSIRLRFVSREEAGEQAFLDTLALTFSEALDADFRRDYREYGARAVMAKYLSDCPEEDDRNTWFSELALDEHDDLVGIQMSLSRKRRNPRKGRSSGCFYTGGVVPDKRGQGYVDDLLTRGTQLLEEAGADSIRSTTAASNFPMANAFKRAHYKQIEHWWEFEIDLSC